MPTYTEPQKSWNAIVSSTMKRLATHVESISPSQVVGRVDKGKQYYLWLSFKNASTGELEYDNAVIRLVGRPDQVDLIDPPGAIDYNGNPRVHLSTGHLNPGQSRGWMIRFRARKSLATKSLKFQAGVYGYLVPQGHYWKTLSPTV